MNGAVQCYVFHWPRNNYQEIHTKLLNTFVLQALALYFSEIFLYEIETKSNI